MSQDPNSESNKTTNTDIRTEEIITIPSNSNSNNKKPKGEVMVFENEDCNFSSKNNSLQSNFKNFRSYMKSMISKNKEISVPSFRENPLRMSELRQKFLDTARTLLGVPYGKKYLIDHPEYDSPLFLDCCGLVRHILSLLKDDFGFHLGKWNQGYQFDTLPDPITFEELKPGDLIFYSGLYYPDRTWKQQPHNMTHVEIYLGEGEKTIGSRDSRGVVSIYDTYQFYSENYYNIEYHYKSIDTWWKGVHKSFCSEHKWHQELLVFDSNGKNKYSAFYDAGEDDENNQDEENKESISTNKLEEQSRKNETANKENLIEDIDKNKPQNK